MITIIGPLLLYNTCTLFIYQNILHIHNTFLLTVISATGQVTVSLLIDDGVSAIVKVKPASLVIPEESIRADEVASSGHLLD